MGPAVTDFVARTSVTFEAGEGSEFTHVHELLAWYWMVQPSGATADPDV